MHRIIACTLFITYMATGTPVVAAAVALLAVLDGSHSVTLADSDGGTQLVLGHRDGNCTPELHDHPGLLAKVLVAFCRPNVRRDHQFIVALTSGIAAPGRDGSRCAPKSASRANQQTPDFIYTTDSCRSRSVTRPPTPAALSRDVAQLQHCRALATVHLVM